MEEPPEERRRWMEMGEEESALGHAHAHLHEVDNSFHVEEELDENQGGEKEGGEKEGGEEHLDHRVDAFLVSKVLHIHPNVPSYVHHEMQIEYSMERARGCIF